MTLGTLSIPMPGYTKLFNSILASTIWREGDKVRIVWITLLAMADKNGVAEGSVPGLADFARVSIEDVERALEALQAPDKYSRTKEHEGRRIKAIEGGWLLLNHSKYRAKMNADERRAYNREKQREWRAGQKLSNKVNDSQSQCEMSALSAHTEAAPEAEAKEVQKKEDVFSLSDSKPKKTKGSVVRFVKPTIESVREFCEGLDLPTSDGDAFFLGKEATGWKNVKDWKATIRHWKAQGWMASQKVTSNPKPGYATQGNCGFACKCNLQGHRPFRGLDGKTHHEDMPRTDFHDEWGRAWRYFEDGAKVYGVDPRENQIG